ncbi:hypothetical protein Ae717Ps2_6122 [Pseudonocardia sp. Ae717_Ps2]|nr:hypothetical protein Ae717Ps2_6812 [Pseudonocardia sp. Ae717_Ps2]OLM28803.1 hypothetical protein Ae717Ps2_6122 [Pseudonocardia sp. Ae717_Ps2]
MNRCAWTPPPFTPGPGLPKSYLEQFQFYGVAPARRFKAVVRSRWASVEAPVRDVVVAGLSGMWESPAPGVGTLWVSAVVPRGGALSCARSVCCWWAEEQTAWSPAW